MFRRTCYFVYVIEDRFDLTLQVKFCLCINNMFFACDNLVCSHTISSAINYIGFGFSSKSKCSLQDKANNEEHKRTVLNRLKRKANYAKSDNEPLLCIGFQLSEFSLWNLGISKKFTKPAYFNDSYFFGKTDFSS